MVRNGDFIIFTFYNFLQPTPNPLRKGGGFKFSRLAP